MTFSALFRRMMKAKGMRQTDVAEVANVSRQYVSDLCSGRVSNPGVETIRPIVEAMGWTMAEFFEGE